MFHKLFLKCEEAAIVCDKSQYDEATFIEKLKHYVHLLFCKFCQKYSQNNTKLTEAINKQKTHKLNSETKIELQRKIQKELKKQN